MTLFKMFISRLFDSKYLSILFFTSIFFIISCSEKEPVHQFTEQDIVFLKKFSLSNLPPPEKSLSNSVADNLDAAKLGHQLFFDKGLSSNQQVACANCHQPEKYFTDGLKFSKGIGTTGRNAPSLLTSAWSTWLYWDGRKDSLWSQALGPLEHPAEQGVARVFIVKHLAKNYRKQYESLFGSLPSQDLLQTLSDNASPLGNENQKQAWDLIDKTVQLQINQVFANAGKTLMAYQRQLRMPLSPFDKFIDGMAAGNLKSENNLSVKEVNGLRLFVGKANCVSCHNGSLFTNFEFHNIGAPESDKQNVDLGRYLGVKQLIADEFTCLSQYSDAKPNDCSEMRFLKKQGAELIGAFKTPSLRNIGKTAPYMQTGQFDTLEQVIEHYNAPTPPYYDRKQHVNRPHFDILPLRLSEIEKSELIAFLQTLTSPLANDDFWWEPPER